MRPSRQEKWFAKTVNNTTVVVLVVVIVVVVVVATAPTRGEEGVCRGCVEGKEGHTRIVSKDHYAVMWVVSQDWLSAKLVNQSNHSNTQREPMRMLH